MEMSGSGKDESGNVCQPRHKSIERSESNGEHLATKSRKVEYELCSHCNKEISNKVYKEHRRLYFDLSLREWNQEVLSDNDDTSSEFSSLFVGLWN